MISLKWPIPGVQGSGEGGWLCWWPLLNQPLDWKRLGCFPKPLGIAAPSSQLLGMVLSCLGRFFGEAELRAECCCV